MKPYRYLDIVTAVFVSVLLLSNVASSAKIIDLHMAILGLALVFDAGTLLFPISYIFGDVLTEVYGYAQAKRVIWIGFFMAAFMSAFFWLVHILPGEAAWQSYAGDAAFVAILGSISSGGIIMASLLGYLCGEFANSYVLAKMKIASKGKHLWQRTIGSTLVGQAVDTTVFVIIACSFGVFPWEIAASLIIANYIFKVGIEVIFTPVTYKVVNTLKKGEGVDWYDNQTNFNPFAKTN